MLGLGKQVLQKIQNLLVQVQRKNPKNANQKDNQNTARSKSKSKQPQYTKKSAKPIQKKHPSTIQQEDKQNACSHRIEQLYLNHFIKEKRMLDRNLHCMEEEMKNLKNFKVENKTSQFLIQKQKFKPIYQRTPEIIKKKQKSIEKIKQTAPKTRQELEQDQAIAIMEQQKRKYHKLTREEFEHKMEQMRQRNLLRMERVQKKKLMDLAQKSVTFLEKPELNSTSKAWWEKKKLKKNLSSNVFQRFNQYDLQKKQKWEKYLQRRKQQETPFTPRIGQATRDIVKKSLSRRSLIENIPRSRSCRNLSKRQQASTFIERRQGQSTDRSISRNLTHGKSVATMSSSRNALVQRRFI